jgi:hypothetical protein
VLDQKTLRKRMKVNAFDPSCPLAEKIAETNF